MSNITKIAGCEEELILRMRALHVNSNSQNVTNSMLKPNINPNNIFIMCYVLLGIFILSFISLISLLTIFLPLMISSLISLFFSFFLFNIYRLCLNEVFSPASDYQIFDPNSIIITNIIKYLFLIVLGVLFSEIVLLGILQKNELLSYFHDHNYSNLGIINLTSVSGEILTFQKFILFLVCFFIFLTPQTIWDFKIDKLQVKIINSTIAEEKLNDIFMKDKEYVPLSIIKEDYFKAKYINYSTATNTNNSFTNQINNKMAEFILNKKM